ncbi:phage head-tail connector protein [Salipaludibacillus sp. HK11]|uniref:phage head-tail connector protein n=1 Tax=Salipaludibacillus sp. HK11 TaxID=3394320 RepID=UPI0039FC059A
MPNTINQRVLVRLPDINTALLQEYITTATDRIKARVEEETFPDELNSVAVEVVCAMHNKRHHSGIKNEGVDTFQVSFVEDILKEYEDDFHRYLVKKEKAENENRGVVRFL